jgi:hypothetical protein
MHTGSKVVAVAVAIETAALKLLHKIKLYHSHK